MMLGLVGFHEGGENVQLISGFGAELCIHQMFDAEQRTLMIPLGFDRRNIHGFCTLSDGVYIDLVILLMGADETNVDNLIGVVNFHHQSVLVPCNIEHRAAALQHAR